ncbi:hypothetical protein [Microcoleus sp. N9_A1]|uniref:hypothetical protein n=1 Tax=Microcoleus sp. N9_A1 TaxID=3055380 RepID=UPI002FD5CB0F
MSKARGFPFFGEMGDRTPNPYQPSDSANGRLVVSAPVFEKGSNTAGQFSILALRFECYLLN